MLTCKPACVGILMALSVAVPLSAAPQDQAAAAFQSGIEAFRQNKFKDAETIFRGIFESNPSNSQALMGLTEALMSQGKNDEAVRLLQAEVSRHPERGDYHSALGNAAARAKQYDLAITEFKKVLSEAGVVYLRLAEVYRLKGELENAISASEQARYVLPDNFGVIMQLAMLLESAGRKKEAKANYEAALKMQPANGAALNNLAYLIAEEGGDMDAALDYAKRAQQALPNDPNVADTLGSVYLKKNAPQEAIPIFRDLVQRTPTSPIAHYHLALALKQGGDQTGAIAEFEAALKNNPPKAEEQTIRELMKAMGR